MSNTADMRAAWAPACTDHRGTMQAAYRALDAVFKKWNYAPVSGMTGSFNCRQITGGSNYSLHAYKDGDTYTFWNGTAVTMAAAVDVNWNKNPYGSRLITDMPRGMVDEICSLRTANDKQLWGWGGYYLGNKDAMHFELHCTAADIRTGIRGLLTIHPEDDMFDTEDRKKIDSIIVRQLNNEQSSEDIRQRQIADEHKLDDHSAALARIEALLTKK